MIYPTNTLLFATPLSLTIKLMQPSGSTSTTPTITAQQQAQQIATEQTTQQPAKKRVVAHHGHGHGHDESAITKFFISGTVAWSFELVIGHYLEAQKIAKQATGQSYITLTRGMVKKGIAGVWDGFFPWGSIQCFVKGAAFGAGQTAALNILNDVDALSPFWAETLSGGAGGFFQGLAMSPLLLLKTRVITMPEMRGVVGAWQTTKAATRMGGAVIKQEGLIGLTKGSFTFSMKRVADWTTRFFFAELVADMLRNYYRNDTTRIVNGTVVLNNTDKSIAAFGGGALSAIATVPLDVIVATMQSAGKAGQKVSIMSIWAEQMKEKGVIGLLQYSTRGTIARTLHVGLTTMMMKTISSLVYDVFSKVKEVAPIKPKTA